MNAIVFRSASEFKLFAILRIERKFPANRAQIPYKLHANLRTVCGTVDIVMISKTRLRSFKHSSYFDAKRRNLVVGFII